MTAVQPPGESPDIVYGRLLESAHISGYGFERMTDELEWLLEGDRWQKVGSGYTDVNAFLGSIDLSAFRIDDKKRLHQRIKELQPKATTRSIGKATGTPTTTVHRHLNPPVPNGTPETDSAPSDQGKPGPPVPNGTPTQAPFDRSPKDVADRVRKEVRKEVRLAKKAEKVAEIQAQLPAPLDAEGTFPVLYVDPPWRYEHAEPTRAIENHYPTMGLDEIKALDVPADPDAVLFLWATSPKLAEALEVMAAWGFGYRTSMVWVKDRIGMGYYARQRHELLLIGRRGNYPVPDPEDRPDSVIEAPLGDHSAKPERAYELIERMYPFARRVELFARLARDGWARWGNQATEVA